MRGPITMALIMALIVAGCGWATAAGGSAGTPYLGAAAGGSWTLTGSLHTPRAILMAVTLQNGKVLVAGGIDKHNQPLASAELFDPKTGKWSVTGSMHDVRADGTLTLLKNGKVLAAGGFTFPQQPSGMTAELYDPATGKWSPTGQMTAYRVNHTATLLVDGKVLVTGGITKDQTAAVASAEIYDPSNGTWTKAAHMSTPRALHAATLLASGQVLVSGGDHDIFFGAQGSAEVYDPGTGRWTVVGRMMTSRRLHTSTALADGTVIVTGGNYGTDIGGAGGNPSAMTDRYDPAAGRWSPAGDLQVIPHGVPTVVGRSDHTATALNDGRILVAGGDGHVDENTFTVFKTSEIFDPNTNVWTLVADMHLRRTQHAAVLLADGRVLAIAGSTIGPLTPTCEIFTPAKQSGAHRVASSAWLDGSSVTALPRTAGIGVGPFAQSVGRIDARAITFLLAKRDAPRAAAPATLVRRTILAPQRRVGKAIGKWTVTGSMHVVRGGAGGLPGVLLKNGKVLVEGCDHQLGQGGVTAELWDPKTGKWSLTGSMHVPRCNHGAALLPDGRVLVAGGDAMGTVHSESEIYDPATGKWTLVPHMNSTRFLVSMLTLADGRPFVPAGAAYGTIPRDSADRYDPASGTWTATPSEYISRYIYGSSVLLDGKVLVFGGFGPDMQWEFSSELYDPKQNLWRLRGSTNGQADVSVTLVTGDVLATAPSQLFAESTGKWTPTKTDMQIPRINDTMTLLQSGRVLAAGGDGSGSREIAQSEVYDPTTQSWALDAPMNVARSNHAAVRLQDGRVLVAGGLVGFTEINSAEVYTPGH